MGADWTYTGNAENEGRRAQRERFARAAFQAHGPGSNPGRRTHFVRAPPVLPLARCARSRESRPAIFLAPLGKYVVDLDPISRAQRAL